MKKIYTSLLVIVLFGMVANAQETEDRDTSEVKKGWSFGVLPAVTYNTDLGLQYGGLIDLYNFGDGEIYPNYYERYYLEISRFTKGNGINNFAFESNRLLKGSTVFFDLMYRTDKQYDFLGANGYESMYNVDWVDGGKHEKDDHEDYHSKMFYKNETNFFKVKADVLTPINDKWSWSAGFEYYNYTMSSFDASEYNDGRKYDDEKVPELNTMPGLYDRYVKWGLIDEEHAEGGRFGGLKAGIMYDTRNSVSNATKGIWTELVFFYVPEFLSSPKHSYLKLNFTHRQYFTLIPKKLSFTYRLGYAGNIYGDEPYYALSNMYAVMLKGAPQFGLGGAYTLRGVKRNRVIGNGEAWLNAEFRWKFYKFKMFKQNFYLGLSAFFDAGRVVQLLPLEDKVNEVNAEHPLTDSNYWGEYAIGYENDDTIDDYFNFGAEKPHMSAGLGFQVVMNENFIVKVDYGRTFNIQDGPSGMYIGLNYLF